LRLRRAPAEGPPALPPGPVPGRNVTAVSVAPARGPLPGVLGRHPRLRRDRLDRTTPDRAPLPRPVLLGADVRAGSGPADPGSGTRPRLLAEALEGPGIVR